MSQLPHNVAQSNASNFGSFPLGRLSRTIVALVAFLSLTPLSASATEECEQFNKQVSVDGGLSWSDADDPASAPTQVVGGGALYRFIVTNCFANKVCVDTSIDDPDLGIFDALVPGQAGPGELQPLEQVVVTEADPGFWNLYQPDRCDTPGIKVNKATETTTISPSGEVETFMDEAFVYCVPPELTIEKFTNGYDADDANGFPVTTPPRGGFVVGASQVPLVAAGQRVTWNYIVTNDGPERLVDVQVTDSEVARVRCPRTALDPGESMTCIANGLGLDLDTASANIVYGCGAQGMGSTQPTYENLGTVVGTGETSGVVLTDEDPSHYCNPPDVMIEKFTNGHDGDDPNGIPAPGSGSFSPGDTTVAEVPSEDPITWTYVVTNNGPEALEHVVVSDSRGVLVSCPQDTLASGESMTCTATGSAEDLATTGGDVDGCGSGTGDTRPTYENLGSVTAHGVNSYVLVEDDDPSHYCNPMPPADCGLTVDKTCELPPPPSADGKCDGKLEQFTMIWPGSPITVSGPANSAPGGLVATGDEVTFFGPFSNNDVVVDLSGAQNGQSTFHVSCSDKDMDGDTATNEDQQQVSSFGRDCGKFQGDGKGSSGINDWLLEGFVDKTGGVLDCTTEPAAGATSCELQPFPADCDAPTRDPDALTWLYSGGGCAASDSDQQSGDLFCTGSVDGSLAATITDDGGNVFDVAPGGTFTNSRSDSKVFTLTNAGGTEESGRHVSCSQPLQAGDVYGSLTLAAMNGVGIGSDVVYAYQVSNEGATAVSNITVDDDQLGSIGGIASLAPGESETLTATAFISTTTTNVATVDGDGPPGAECSAESNPVVVSVLPPPPCSVSIAFKELKDDAIKWTLSNAPGQRATMESLQLFFPAEFDAIKEVKLDGGIFKARDSDTFPNGVGSGVVIGPADWTQSDVSKRQLDSGESRTLEVKFRKKFTNAEEADFDLTVTFEEGCTVGF